MSKIYPYIIHHLNHEHLILLEQFARKKQCSEDEIESIEIYKNLMSNLPRHDPSISQVFGSKIWTLEKSKEELSREVLAMDKARLARKVKSSIALLNKGLYIKVAEVDEETGEGAVNATISVNKRWMLLHSKKVKPTDRAWRSTESYDIIQRFDEFFLKMPLGFIDLKGGEYAEKLV